MRKLLLTIGSALALAPLQAHAYILGTSWTGPICAFLPCSQMGGGSSGLSSYLVNRIVTALEIGFVAVAALVLFFATVNMVLFPHEEEVVKQGRFAFLYTIVGGAFVGLARWFALAFAPASVGANLVDVAQVNAGVQNVMIMFRLVLSLLLTINITLQGVRLVSSQGEQELVDRARKRLINGFIGVVFVMLANVVVMSIVPGTGGASTLANEIAGVANYLIAIVGFAAVVTIIVAGILLILSVSETLKDKAKSIIKIAVVALVAVVVSYALVTGFIALS